MNKKYYLLIILFLLNIRIFSQDETDTSSIQDDSLQVEDTDPQRKIITDMIKQINSRFMELNDIIASGEIKVKSPKYDETASIEIKAKKKNDVWFHIDGPLGIDVAEAHFDRKKFLFYNALNDEVVSGSSSIINIGTLTKIRCTFDDLLNAFTGSVRIFKSKKDSIWMTEEGNYNVISLKRGTITRKYWVNPVDLTVNRYAYYNKNGKVLIQFEFSNFTPFGGSSFAKKIEVRRPEKNEYFRLDIEEFNTGNSYMGFNVSYPSDVKRKIWK